MNNQHLVPKSQIGHLDLKYKRGKVAKAQNLVQIIKRKKIKTKEEML